MPRGPAGRRSRSEIVIALALTACGGVINVPQRDAESHEATTADAEPIFIIVDAAADPARDADEEFITFYPTYGMAPPPPSDD